MDDATAWGGVVRTGERSRLRLGAVALLAGALVVGLAVAVLRDPPPDGPADATVDPPTTAPSPVGDVRVLTDDDAAAPATEEQPGLTFAATGLAGGGFQNVAAWSPDGATVLLGGDVSGIARSVDGGVTWHPVAAALPNWSEKVAAIAFDPDDPQVVVAGAGFDGRFGGVLRSEDGGVTWTVASEQIAFSGGNTPDAEVGPDGHPRATGDLLVWVGPDTIVAGLYDAGLARSTDGGRTWTPIAMPGTYVRGMALDADGRLLVGTYGDGLWAVTDPAGTAQATAVAGSPRVVEEVAVDGTDVVVAAGAAGVQVLDTTDGSWRTVLQPVAVATTTVEAAAGRWWVGVHEPERLGEEPDAERDPGIWTSEDRGETWTRRAQGDGLRTVVAGVGIDWWIEMASTRILPSGGDWTAGQFAVDPADPDRVVLAGRAGAWRSTDGGRSFEAAVAGLGATTHDQTVVLPDGRIAIGNTDHRLLVSDDQLATVTVIEPGLFKGTAVAVDATAPPGTLLVATADRDDNTDGEVFRVVAGGTEFTALGLGQRTGGKRPIALASGVDADGRGVVLAGVEEGGVWRLVDGTWTSVATPLFSGAQGSPIAQLAWVDGTQVVLALDRTSGLWRSPDAGLTWELLRPLDIETERIDPTGFLALDGVDPNRAWLTLRDRVVRFDGVLVGDPSATELPLALAGPAVGLPDGGLLVATDDEAGIRPGLVHICGEVVTPLVVGSRYLGGAVDPTDIDLATDGHVVLTTISHGVLRSSTPATAALACDVG